MDPRKMQMVAPFIKMAAANHAASAAADELTEAVRESDTVLPEEPKTVQAEDLDVHIERSYHVAKSDTARRYTLGPLYVPDYIDAHDEFTNADEMESASWEYVRAGNRDINLEHTSKRAGEWVGLLSWPFPVEVEMIIPGVTQKSKKIKFPPGTPFMGIVWDEWAWDELVVPGKVQGLSMEGFATRVMVEEE